MELMMPVILGLVVACVAIGQQIGQTGVPFNGGFFDTIIFAFVFFGSLACTLMRNSFMDFLGMLLTFIKFVYYSQPKPLQLVQEIVELANVNRRDGPIAMQNVEIKNPFLQKAVNMVVDGCVFLYVCIRTWYIGLRLIVVVIGHKILNRIVWEKLPHL